MTDWTEYCIDDVITWRRSAAALESPAHMIAVICALQRHVKEHELGFATPADCGCPQKLARRLETENAGRQALGQPLIGIDDFVRRYWQNGGDAMRAIVTAVLDTYPARTDETGVPIVPEQVIHGAGDKDLHRLVFWGSDCTGSWCEGNTTPGSMRCSGCGTEDHTIPLYRPTSRSTDGT